MVTGDLQDRDLPLARLDLAAINFMFAYSNSPWATQHMPGQRTTAQVKLTDAVDQMG